MDTIELLLIGLTIGALARFLIPGRQPSTWGSSILLGVAGSFAGALVGRLFGVYGEGQPTGVVMSLGGAIVLLIGYRLIVARKASA